MNTSHVPRVKFTYHGTKQNSGYGCDTPGDQSGLYVSGADYNELNLRLLALERAAKAALEWMGPARTDLEPWQINAPYYKTEAKLRRMLETAINFDLSVADLVTCGVCGGDKVLPVVDKDGCVVGEEPCPACCGEKDNAG